MSYLPDVKLSSKRITIEDAIHSYIYMRLASQVLKNDMQKFKVGVIEVKFPKVYVERIRQSLEWISSDLHKTLAFFQEVSIQVADKPISVEGTVLYEYWIEGQSRQFEQSSSVMRKETKKAVQHYLAGRRSDEKMSV